jgi:radical SAM protein with 4Fe4S-binding SPASM domain
VTPFAFGPPSGLLIEITSRCNLTCIMCPLTAGDTPSSKDPGHLSPDRWADVVSFATEAGQVNVGGYGEPFSNPKCLQYLGDLDAAGVRISLTTNATMVNERIAGQLAALPNLINVNVSVDSPDPDLYQAIRGGELRHAMAGVGHLAKALGPDRLTVSSVMMRRNIDSLAAFPAILSGLGLNKYVLQGLVDYTPEVEGEEFTAADHLPDRVDRIRAAAKGAAVELLFELPDRTQALLRGDDVGATPPAPDPSQTRVCFAPWDVPVVDKDGRVFPCCFAMTHGKAVLGNLHDATLHDIWHGRQFHGFRRALTRAETTPGTCRECTVAPAGPHPFAELSAEVLEDASHVEGGEAMTVVMRNTGTATWSRQDQMHLGTAEPRDHASAFHRLEWIGVNRVGTFEEVTVPPGATATFRFKATPSAGVDAETLQLVAEHRAWIPGTRVRIRPTAEAGSRVRRALHRLVKAVK